MPDNPHVERKVHMAAYKIIMALALAAGLPLTIPAFVNFSAGIFTRLIGGENIELKFDRNFWGTNL